VRVYVCACLRVCVASAAKYVRGGFMSHIYTSHVSMRVCVRACVCICVRVCVCVCVSVLRALPNL